MPLKGKLLMPMIHGPALPVSIWIKIKKKSRIFFQKREIVEVSWNPTWEPEELQNTCESFKQSLKNYEEQITAPNLSQPALDEHLNDLQKQGFSAIQEDNKYQPYNVDFRNKVSFDSNPPTHRLTLRPQGIVSTGSQPLISWLSRKEYPILPRWHHASWSVNWHSSLYLQCRRKVLRYDYSRAPKHTTKGLSQGNMQRSTQSRPTSSH